MKGMTAEGVKWELMLLSVVTLNIFDKEEKQLVIAIAVAAQMLIPAAV